MKKKKIIKDANYKIKFDDREYLEEILSDNDIEMTPEELCYQLTAYESNGAVNYKQGIEEIIGPYYVSDPEETD